jgi:AMP deaminase
LFFFFFFFFFAFHYPNKPPLDEAITAELRELYNSFQACLDLREKYMKKSKQRFRDDPKNKEDWEIYPAPPQPSWPLPPPEELARRKQREKEREADPIAAIGIDFDLEHVKLPEAHPVSSVCLKREIREITS